LIKEFDGEVLPYDMIFHTLDLWVCVLDLPMDTRNRAYNELIGGCIGKFVSVDVDEKVWHGEKILGSELQLEWINHFCKAFHSKNQKMRQKADGLF
jgi:hypothetical protein